MAFETADYLVLAVAFLAVIMGKFLGSETRLLNSCLLVAILSGDPVVVALWLIANLLTVPLSLVRKGIA